MTTTDFTTDSKTIAGIIDYLDGHLEALGGYNLNVIHYDFDAGRHRINVTIFAGTRGRAQAAADTLGVTFHRSLEEKWQHHYSGHRDGVEYTFLLPKNLEEYPEAITPVTGGHVE